MEVNHTLIEELIKAEVTKHDLVRHMTDLERHITELRDMIFGQRPALREEPAPPEPAPPEPAHPTSPPRPSDGLPGDIRGTPIKIATRIVREHAGPITIAALATLGGITEHQARGCISALLRNGTVRRVEDGYESTVDGRMASSAT